MLKLLVVYFLGAFSFWPLILLCLYFFGFIYKIPVSIESDDDSFLYNEDKSHLGDHRPSSIQIDSEGDVDVSCWVRKAPTYLGGVDSCDDEDIQVNKFRESGSSSAFNSLQNLMRHTKLIRNSKSSVGVDNPKSQYDCPKLWAVVRGGQLQLFEDQSESKIVHVSIVSHYVVTIWPSDLREFELFFKRFPIVLISRTQSNGLVTLDLEPGKPPRDAEYLYVENPIEKEDLYFALVKASRSQSLDTDEEQNISLGPRDPLIMAKPIRVRKSEVQKLQSSIWSNELPTETQWLNALLGRIFLAIKESKMIDDYIRKRFSYKLQPISAASNIIGDIEIRSVQCGSSAPYLYNIKLRELTPEGNLVITAGIKYNGGFRVILGTYVKLAAVTSLTSREIPVELAATVKHLNGTLLFRIKPAPSERIWYAFENMPDVDLHIEPVVYETQISLSMVSNFIKSKILDTLKESLVVPYMDDLVFHDTTGSFYRGGIWESILSRSEQTAIPADLSRSESKKPSVRSSSSSSNFAKSVMCPDETTESNSTTRSSRSTNTIRKLGNWVGFKRTTTDASSIKSSISNDSNSDFFDNEVKKFGNDNGVVNLSPNSILSSRSPATTHVTTASASVEPSSADTPDNISEIQDLLRKGSASPSKRSPIIRKPVPNPRPSLMRKHKNEDEHPHHSVNDDLSSPHSADKENFESDVSSSATEEVTFKGNSKANLDKVSKPDFSALKQGNPSIGTVCDQVNGEISLTHQKDSVRENSIPSTYSSVSPDSQSIISNASSSKSVPSLPPRKRTVVHLSYVPPEQDL